MESVDIQILLGFFSLAYTVIEIMAIITAVTAVRDTRTPQGAVAWTISLVSFPLLSLPLYWIFGRSKFHGYVETIRDVDEQFRSDMKLRHNLPEVKKISERQKPHAPRCSFETMARMPFAGGNELELYTSGNATFEAIFEAIEKATDSLLIQFYIVHEDNLGKRMQASLLRKAEQGLTIRFLYDEIGSHATPESFWQTMRKAGIEVHPFHTTKGRGNRFQLNFRNHRKIVIADNRIAFVGGHNVGDEYLGKSKHFSGWRDTHMRITGPAILGVGLSFARDWHWATGELLDVAEKLPPQVGNAEVLAFSTSPADPLETCSLMFIRAINSARKRFWIASPYFVPDSGVTKALQLAAMRGVDVRIILPHKADHILVYLAGFSCLKELQMETIRVFRYQHGFMHQKVFLVDDALAGVGTANLDNRSFRLNFELTMLVEDPAFCSRIESMFLTDFMHSDEVGTEEFDNKNIIKQTVIRFARLFSPIL
ncbi:cardiolipin synthase [Pseudodesulfovibrio sp.]|uniref:cardiolipin synthase n=1 Tax=unclassified Pseudodesulfovibrio TaxID=2661612 RepID=UPI003AFF7E96